MLKNFEKIYANVLTGKENLNKKEIQVCCPFHNDKNPSMSINTETGKYICFSCNEHGSAVGYWMKIHNVDYKTALKQLDMFDENYKPHPAQVIQPKPPKPKKPEVDYSEYCNKVVEDSLLSETEFARYGKKLYELRGITYDTAVACGIGYDSSKGWIFPFNRLGDNKCCGYEIRHKEFKKFDFNNSKCYKAKDSVSCLSVVWQGWEDKKCICCEGLIDSCFMYQYLHEKAQRAEKSITAIVKETIITPTNGVKTILELVIENKLWDKFEEILFVLDEDEAGRTVTNELKQLASENGYNFKFYSGLKEGQDWEDKYKELLKTNT